ncbi:MAG: UvrD-helicase domain-containing protein [bacterium]
MWHNNDTDMDKAILAGLNREQLAAVKQINGPVLVLAGAGSGKTKALTQRIAYLVASGQALPSQILAITFTNKAAGEIRDRVLKLTGKRVGQALTIGTFHSVCARLLRIEARQIGYGSNFTILDSDDQLAAVKRAMEQLNIDTKRTAPEAVRAHISSAKNELIEPTAYARMAAGSFQQTVARVYPVYQDIVRRSQAMDFDDLIMNTVKLFEASPEVLAKYQQRFKYILVDEYQDTNTAQYRLTKLLAQDHRNLFVVGDDWQSIYSWRGANFQNILDFNRDYPDARVVKLERNYRSTQTILDAAHAVIVHNQNRSQKKLWTEQSAGEPITLYEALNEKDEADFVIREVQRHQVEHNAHLSDFVVLYRTNAQSRSLEESLLRAGMPYRVVGGVRFYERREIKDMLAFLSLLVNPNDNLALIRVINIPRRGIGKQTLDGLERAASEQGLSIYQHLVGIKQPTPAIADFLRLIGRLTRQSQKAVLSRLLDMLLTVTGYKQMLKDEGVEGETRLENILELKSVMEKYDHLKSGEALGVFLEEVRLVSDIDTYQPDDEALTLMTIHSAKGLEFDHVFLVGMEENLFPHSRTLFDQAELEEERRLCYVGITRAKQKVYLTHACERLLYGGLQNNSASRFISDIPDYLVEVIRRGGTQRTIIEAVSLSPKSRIKPGSKVTHKQFGAGVVISKTGEILTIAFAKEGIKNLVEGVADLKPTAQQ